MEGNPIAASFFSKLGLLQGILLAKALSIAVFFGLLWYCIKIRWSMADIVRMIKGQKPKRDPIYVMKWFYSIAVVATLLSLYASGGWIYLLIYLGLAS